jgi:hypothetical protein
MNINRCARCQGDDPNCFLCNEKDEAPVNDENWLEEAKAWREMQEDLDEH